MPRQWHILRGNKNSETVHNLIVFDTETRATRLPDGSERDKLWFGWLCIMSRTSTGAWGQRRYHRFTRINQFWDIVESVARPNSKWFLFCHNTSFDLPIVDIFRRPPKRGWLLKTAVIEAPPTIITYRREKATLTFLDTLNWWRMPLAKIGERLGLPKLKMPSPRAPKAEWDAYGKRDVEVLVETLLRWFDFLQLHDLGGFASTLASQAFRSYRHRFMPTEIVIDGDEASHAFSRRAYHGGRVECFKLGKQKGPIYHYDINSMYPAVMRDNQYPVRLVTTHPTQDSARWPKLLSKYAVVAQCVIDARTPCYPVKLKEGLCFPTGRLETTLTTPEIRVAMKRGELREMSNIVLYKKAKIFGPFVRFVWDQRRECADSGDKVGEWLFKILANSLYGKFGQTGQVYETWDNTDDLRALKYTIVDYDTKKVYKVRQMGGLRQCMSSEGEARDSFPAIAAHVTAYARLLLWKLIEAAGLENVLYCDTDSLFVTRAGSRRLKRFIKPKQLGYLKHEGTYPWMVIHGLKDYEVPGHIVRKGVRANAKEISPGVFEQVQWSSLKGLLGKGDLSAPTRKQVIKRLRREYKKVRAV